MEREDRWIDDPLLAEQPPAVRRAAARLDEILRRAGMPPRPPDSAPLVIMAYETRGAFEMSFQTLASALEEITPDDPALADVVRRRGAEAAETPNGAVILILGADGSFWCGPLGSLTGAEGAEA